MAAAEVKLRRALLRLHWVTRRSSRNRFRLALESSHRVISFPGQERCASATMMSVTDSPERD